MTLYCYPRCSTCREAARWLDEHDISYESVDIRTHPPDVETLRQIHKHSQLPLKRLFNTSGNSYRELGLARTFDDTAPEELLHLLSQDGMLIKRPIIRTDERVLIGFHPDIWELHLPEKK